MREDYTQSFSYFNEGEEEWINEWCEKNYIRTGFQPTLCGDCCGFYDDYITIYFKDRFKDFKKEAKQKGYKFKYGKSCYRGAVEVHNIDSNSCRDKIN